MEESIGIPYLRGYGPTRFLSSETVRDGQPSALALDIIALMDALKIERAVIAGFDWGARTANIIAALWPERCKARRSSPSAAIWSAARQPVRYHYSQAPSSNGGTSSTSPPNAADTFADASSWTGVIQ